MPLTFFKTLHQGNCVKEYPHRDAQTLSPQRVSSPPGFHLIMYSCRTSAQQRLTLLFLSVYEQSLYLSIIFSVPAQTIAVLPHLLPAEAEPLLQGDGGSFSSAKLCIVILALLHTLITHHPSSSAYLNLLRATSSPSTSHPGIDWVMRVAQAIRRHMFIRLDHVTRPEAVHAILASIGTEVNTDRDKLVSMALHTLVSELRSKARSDAWKVLRSAYPQFDLGSNKPQSEGKPSRVSEGGGVDDTHQWIVRVLSLGGEKYHAESEASRSDIEVAVERWFTEREKLGEVQRSGPNAAGAIVEGRWVVKIKR